MTKPRRDPALEARLAALPEPDLDDEDNPEWTAEDFARARPLKQVLPDLHAALTSSPTQAHAVREVTLQLTPEVLAHYESQGPDWRDRMVRQLAAPVSRRRRRA